MTQGIALTMELPDLDRLRHQFGEHRDVLEHELDRATVAGLTVLRDEARSRASEFALDARLPNSVRFEHVSGALQGIVGSLAMTGISIERGDIDPRMSVGRRAALLKGWVSRKGLVGTPRSVKTHRVTGRTKQMRAAERELAWRIAMSQRGLERTKRGPLPFIVPAAQAKAHQVEAIFGEAVQRALRKLAGRG